MHHSNHRLNARSPFLGHRRRLMAVLGVLVVALGGVIAVGSASPSSNQLAAVTHTPEVDGGNVAVRLGTYDSRAVAVAYVRSDLSAQKLKVLIDQRAAAEKAGDTKRVKELNEQGELLQRRRHLQGFSTAPIEDILDVVRDQLPGVAEKAAVSVITRTADWRGAGVEVVDVTDALVGLFKPDAQTLKMIAELRKQQPAEIETIGAAP